MEKEKKEAIAKSSKKCGTGAMLPVKRLGVRCPHCGSSNTYECFYGDKVTNGMFCYSCGKASFDGNTSNKVVRLIKKVGEE